MTRDLEPLRRCANAPVCTSWITQGDECSQCTRDRRNFGRPVRTGDPLPDPVEVER